MFHTHTQTRQLRLTQASAFQKTRGGCTVEQDTGLVHRTGNREGLGKAGSVFFHLIGRLTFGSIWYAFA